MMTILQRRKSNKLLHAGLHGFENGGQFVLETKDGMYRGPVDSWKVSDNPKIKKVWVTWKWYCIRRIRNSEFDSREYYWEEIIPKINTLKTLEIEYKWFYFQKKRLGIRDRRVKILSIFDPPNKNGIEKEPCRFYGPDDPTNLVKDEEFGIVEVSELERLKALKLDKPEIAKNLMPEE